MSHSTDAEFEQIIHSDETHIEQLETDDARNLREDLAAPHAGEVGELPVQADA